MVKGLHRHSYKIKLIQYYNFPINYVDRSKIVSLSSMHYITIPEGNLY